MTNPKESGTLATGAEPLTVAWVTDFPVEWLDETPAAVGQMAKQHAASWKRVLCGEFEEHPALRVHVVVVRRDAPNGLVFNRRGITFHLVKTIGGSRALSLFWMDTLFVGRVLRRVRPALVHAWGNERGAGLVASRLPYPNLVTIQGLLNWYGEVSPLNAYERLEARLERTSLRRARSATVESGFGVRYLREHYPRLVVHQAEHAPDWRFHRLERRPSADGLRLLNVGTIAYRKGTDILLRALDGLTARWQFQLTLIGSPGDDCLAPLRQTLSPALWQRVSFRQNLRPEEVAQEMATASMLVFPTRADTSPNAVKEAVVAGLPVVASDVGGIPDYVFPHQNGLIFASGDVAGCARALEQAFQHPQFRRGAVDSSARDKARAYLSPARMAECFLRAYRETLALYRGDEGR